MRTTGDACQLAADVPVLRVGGVNTIGGHRMDITVEGDLGARVIAVTVTEGGRDAATAELAPETARALGWLLIAGATQ